MTPPEIARYQPRENHAEIVLQLAADLFWFRGHFPDLAILPGVAQLSWVMHYSQQLLAKDYAFYSIRQLKFQAPLLPGDCVTLVLDWQPSSRLLTFSYQRHTADKPSPESDNNPLTAVANTSNIVTNTSNIASDSHGGTAGDAIAQESAAGRQTTSNGKLLLCR